MLQWQVGCSGFYYPEWKNIFYPAGLPQRKWFEYYCSQFNSLELNNTFYRFPQLTALQNWYRKSPADFIFSVKAPRSITHYQQFADTDQVVKDFYAVIREGLMEKTGCVLFQLPGSIVYSPDLLKRIIDSMDRSFTNVVEFRNKSWWQQQVYAELASGGIIFCSQSHPKLPDEVIFNTPVIYYRFHGVPVLYQSAYSHEALSELAAGISKHPEVQKAYIYFNNTMGQAGFTNARQIIDMVK